MQGIKRRISFTVLVMAIWAVTLPADADYYDGLRAFDAGDFVVAAAEWEAAGDTTSLRRLGQLYEAGRGVPQSFAIAYAYFNLAAARGDDPSRALRDAIAARMTPADISRAQRMVEGGVINRLPNAASTNSPGSTGRSPPGIKNLKNYAFLAVLDGEWEWDMSLPNSPCDSMFMSPMRIKNGQVRARFNHPAAGIFNLFGKIAMDGSATMYASAEHLQFSFIGTFGPNAATGTTSGTGEADCEGTWSATKKR